MNRYTFLLLGVLLWSVSLTLAFQQLGLNTPTLYMNSEGVVSKNNSMLGLCEADVDYDVSPFDVTIRNENGTDVIATIMCGAPRITYLLTLKGYIPRAGFPTERVVTCLRDDMAYTGNYSIDYEDYNLFLTNPPGFTTQDDHRVPQYHLMDTDPAHQAHMRYRRYNGFPVHDPTEHPHYARDMYLQHNHLPSVSRGSDKKSQAAVGSIAVASAFAPPPAGTVVSVALLAFGGSGGAALDDMQNAIDDLNKKTTALTTELAAQFTAGQVTDKQINDTLYATKSILDDLQVSTSLTATSTKNLELQMEKVTKALEKNMTDVYEYINIQEAQLLNVTNGITASLGALDSIVSNILLNLTGLANTMNYNFKVVADTVHKGLRQAANRIGSLSASQRRLTGIMQEIYMDTPTRRSISRLIISAVLAVQQQTSFKPFVSPDARSPNSRPADYSIFYADSIRILSMGEDGVLHQDDLALFCNVQWALTYSPGFLSFQDILSSIGPDTRCNKTSPQYCTCYMSMDHTSCLKYDNVTVASFYNISDTKSIITAKHCYITLPPSDNVVANNVSTIYDRLSTICSRATWEDAGYIVRSTRLTTSVRSLPVAAICDNDFYAVLISSGSDVDSSNFIFSTLWFLQISFGVAVHELTTYTNQIDGIAPSNVSFSRIPYVTIKGQQGSQTKATFMNFDPVGMVPLYYLSNPSVETIVDVTIGGKLYSRVFDVSIFPPTGYTAPQSFYLAGDPTGASVVYDVTQDDLVASAFASAKKGRVTYNLFDTNNDTTVEAWTKKYNEEYDHFAARNTLDTHRKPVITVSGKPVCNVPLGTSLGTICEIFQFMAPEDFNFDTNTATFRAIKGEYQLKIPIPAGDVYLVVNTGCPAVLVQRLASSAVQLVLTNVVNVDLTVTLKVTGDCVYDIANIRVPKSGTYNTWIAACNTGLGRITLAMYQVNGATLGAVCPNAQNISVSTNRTAFLIETGSADLQFVERVVVVQTSSIMANLAVEFARLTNEMISANARSADVMSLLSAFIPVANLSDYNRANDALKGIAVNIAKVLDSRVGLSIVNTTEVGQVYRDQILSDSELARIASESAKTKLVTLTDSLKNVSTSITAQVEQLNITQRAMDEFAGSLGNFASSVGRAFREQQESAMGGFFDSFADIILGVAGIPLSLIDKAFDFIKLVAQAIKDTVGAFGGLFSGLMNVIIILCIAGAVICGGGYIAYKLWQKQKGIQAKLPKNVNLKDLDAMAANIRNLQASVAKLESQSGGGGGGGNAKPISLASAAPNLAAMSTPTPLPSSAAAITSGMHRRVLTVKEVQELEDDDSDDGVELSIEDGTGTEESDSDENNPLTHLVHNSNFKKP